MSRLFITGDTHNKIDIEKLNTKHFPEQKNLTKDDVLLIAGDFGVPWHKPHAKSDEYLLDQYESRNFTTIFIDGNHENFDALYEYPETIFAGARCHQLRPHIYHAMRGESLYFAGHKILCMGGADSHDKMYRTPYISWWPQERPSLEEFEYARRNLIEQKPDMIVTHDAPERIFLELHPKAHPSTVSEYLEQFCVAIEENHIPVTDWYFGHHHTDDDVEMGGIHYHMRYQRITEISPKYATDLRK